MRTHVARSIVRLVATTGILVAAPNTGRALPPWCHLPEICGLETPCLTRCLDADTGDYTTCGAYGVCRWPPTITITSAEPMEFPEPYGHGLRIYYTIESYSDWRRLDSVATMYSPDGGTTWFTDEAARDPGYDWDNIHGRIVWGGSTWNLRSGHTYTLMVRLTYVESDDDRPVHVYSNKVQATVADYD